jgi:hypothetical protein
VRRRLRALAAGLVLVAAVTLAVWRFGLRDACFAGDPGAVSAVAPPALAGGAVTVTGHSDDIAVDLVRGEPLGKQRLVRLQAGTLVTVSGWAIDHAARRLAHAVLVRIDGAEPLRADYCDNRIDVARFFGVPAYERSGFSVRVRVPDGRHRVAFDVLSADRRTLYRDERRFELEGMTSAATMPPAVQGDLTFVDGLAAHDIGLGEPYRRALGRDLSLVGWLADQTIGTPAPARAVDVLVDGRVAVAAAYGAPRPDVATFLHAPSLQNAGFSARIFTDDIRPGRHEITIRATLADGRTAILPRRLVLELAHAP